MTLNELKKATDQVEAEIRKLREEFRNSGPRFQKYEKDLALLVSTIEDLKGRLRKEGGGAFLGGGNAFGSGPGFLGG